MRWMEIYDEVCHVRNAKKKTYHVWTIREINQLKIMAEKMMTTKQAASVLSVPDFSVKNACHRYGIKFNNRGFFRKGKRPWNKGMAHNVSPDTQYKKGNLPHNTKFDGAIRVQSDYKYIRIAKAKWMPLHRYIWTQVYGDPGSNLIRFKDGNTMNCGIENLTMVSRGENAALNSLIRKPRGKRQLIAY